MPIPVNPASIANAGVYTPSGAAIPVNLCKSPSEGMKALSMQFDFVSKPAWLVSFPSGPGQLMSQIAALYVDNTKNNFGVNILFPDTGYQVRVEPSGSRMIPVITGISATPNFYVILDDNGNTSATDIVNIIALNQFVPEFSSNELQNVLSFGYSEFFIPQPLFTQSNFFNILDNFRPVGGLNIIPNVQWFLTAIEVNSVLRTNDNSTQIIEISLVNMQIDNAGSELPVSFLVGEIIVTPSWSRTQLFNMPLQMISQPKSVVNPANLPLTRAGYLIAQYTNLTAALDTDFSMINGNIWYNPFGGVLVS